MSPLASLARLLVLAALPAAALAQYAGPGIDACRVFAERELREDGATAVRVVIERDRHLGLERYTKKAGSQFVSSLLVGHGAVVRAPAPAIEMRFVCLLAHERQAVFFHWVPRADASALSECSRGGGDAGGCLDALTRVLEQDLTQAYAARFQEAREADARAGHEAASDAFRRSNAAWLAYRDAECARRGGSGDAAKACALELGRRRLADVR